jgi:hypothetical protein
MIRTMGTRSETDIALDARTRVRLPDQMLSGRVFGGWGPCSNVLSQRGH